VRVYVRDELVVDGVSVRPEVGGVDRIGVVVVWRLVPDSDDDDLRRWVSRVGYCSVVPSVDKLEICLADSYRRVAIEAAGTRPVTLMARPVVSNCAGTKLCSRRNSLYHRVTRLSIFWVVAGWYQHIGPNIHVAIPERG
jgi:hypothetical protein